MNAVELMDGRYSHTIHVHGTNISITHFESNDNVMRAKLDTKTVQLSSHHVKRGKSKFYHTYKIYDADILCIDD